MIYMPLQARVPIQDMLKLSLGSNIPPPVLEQGCAHTKGRYNQWLLLWQPPPGPGDDEGAWQEPPSISASERTE